MRKGADANLGVIFLLALAVDLQRGTPNAATNDGSRARIRNIMFVYRTFRPGPALDREGRLLLHLLHRTAARNATELGIGAQQHGDFLHLDGCVLSSWLVN